MGTDVDRARYRFGGYLLTKRSPRPAAWSSDLLPERLLTASPCLGSFVPGRWLWDPGTPREDREHDAAALGLDPDTCRALADRVSAGLAEGTFGRPHVIVSSDGVRDLLRVLPASREWVVLGLGLHERNVAEFLEDSDAAGGLHDVLARRAALPPGGTVLGFEPLGLEWDGAPHSWLCNSLETECFDATGVRPNEAGFLSSDDDAERVAAHINEDAPAEPVLWLPWLLVEYTAEMSRATGTGSASERPQAPLGKHR